MRRNYSYFIWPRDLDFITGFRSIEEFSSKRGMVLTEPEYQDYSISFNSYESAQPDSFEEFLNSLKHSDSIEHFRAVLPFQNLNEKTRIRITIDYTPRCLGVAISSNNDDTIVAANDYIRKEWQLSNPPIFRRQDGRPRNLQATVFLGKHFDADSEPPSKILRRFLQMLRFDVQEADEYRATTIPDKVKNLIESQDIYVGLVIGKRDHTWLTAEAAFAHGKNRHVIMVVEEGSNFNPTIQGRDYEQIRIPLNSIEKSFLPLMGEFRSLGISGI